MEIRKQLDEIIKESTEWKAVNNVLMLLWNNHPPTLIMNIFDKDPANFEEENQHGYYDKFLQAISSNPASVWSMLDKDKQERLVELSIEKYR
jgi:hypothetical protein